MISVSAFKWVPPKVQGQVRDLRVRWALEEAGLDYESNLIGFEDQASPTYRRLQPFGQVPAYRENGLEMFESGAIVLHIAERSEILLPHDSHARARAVTWMFAALNSMEVVIQPLAEIDLFFSKQVWAAGYRAMLEARVQTRLRELAACLGEKPYLEGEFSAGDLLMTTVLRILSHTEYVRNEALLAAYQSRCEARPAFQRALSAQLASFEKR